MRQDFDLRATGTGAASIQAFDLSPGRLRHVSVSGNILTPRNATHSYITVKLQDQAVRFAQNAVHILHGYVTTYAGLSTNLDIEVTPNSVLLVTVFSTGGPVDRLTIITDKL